MKHKSITVVVRSPKPPGSTVLFPGDVMTLEAGGRPIMRVEFRSAVLPGDEVVLVPMAPWNTVELDAPEMLRAWADHIERETEVPR